jgi:hypothetical protein
MQDCNQAQLSFHTLRLYGLQLPCLYWMSFNAASQCAVQPQSIVSALPVMPLASSEQR